MSPAIMQPDPAFGTSATAMSPSWRQALAGLAFVWAALFALTLREWGEMAWQWWNSDSYAHILLIPPIIAWLAWMRRDELTAIRPRPWWPGLTNWTWRTWWTSWTRLRT